MPQYTYELDALNALIQEQRKTNELLETLLKQGERNKGGRPPKDKEGTA